MAQCIKCNRELTDVEIGLHRKLVNRGAKSYMCKNCLANEFGVSTDLLDEKVRQCRKMGCLLFGSLPQDTDDADIPAR